MGAFARGAVALLTTALLVHPVASRRNYIDDCPRACSLGNTPFDWINYHSTESLAACKEPMLLDLSLYNALNKTDSSWTMFACTPDNSDAARKNERPEETLEYEEASVSLELASWGISTKEGKDIDAMKSIVKSMQTWLGSTSKQDQFHIFGHFGQVTAGLYIGPRFDRARTAESVVESILDQLDSTSPLVALQHCGDVGEDTIGVAISTNGDLNSIQRLLRQWREGECPSDHDDTANVDDISVAKAPSTIAISDVHGRGPVLQNRADKCETKQVELGEDCPKMAVKCGISGDDFTKYNSYDKDLCSTLRAGQHVCCTSGDLPDFSPDPFKNGTCYTHRVQTGQDCSYLAASHSLTNEDLEEFNEETWGWRGCGDLQASLNICLSKGTPPFPAPIPGAICGPQVENTTMPEDSSSAEWALLNPCPLNACCNLHGWCGINPEFCEYKESGNPGTGVCVSNCGTSVVNDDIPPDEFANVGYFLASNLKRDCLNMNAYSIRANEYTHIQFAFGDIRDDFSIGLMEGDEEQFEYFKGMHSIKRVISFGGWDFSTFPETYHIFRNGVKEENRDKFAKNVVDFVEEHDLDGVDFDWEYPGAPDIPGIPPGEEEEGERYLEFLKVMRDQLPDGKTLSIAAPASFWYLQAFPIDEIAQVVDYIVYMTYDLRGQWDYDSNDPPLGCPDGNCLRSHVNATETQYALAMITKAQVQTKKLMVGVSSYGRSFEMAEPGCTGPTCKYTGNGASKGRCTDTSGYLANAEINEILDNNDNSAHSYDEKSDSDILVYNDNQWTAYMTDETRNRRLDKYSGMNMGGSVEWSIDLQKFLPSMVPGPGIFLPLPEDMDIEEFCSEPDLDEITEAEASSQRNISAYFDYFFDVRRGGDTSSWTQELFAGSETVSCDTFPDGPCGFPDPGECHGYEPPSLYWAQFVVANYFDHISKFGTMFRDTTFNESLNIGSLVADFPIKTPSDETQSTVFAIFAGSLGIASGVASGAGAGPPGSSGSAGAAAGAVLTGFSGMWTILSAAVEDAEPPDEDDMERALNMQLGTIWNAAYRAGQNGLISLFADGDLSDIPKEYKEGDYEYEISNFFDGRWLHRLTGKFVRDMQNALSENMRKSLASYALTFANYYIMKDGFDTDDCTDQTGGKVIDDVCYTLEYPGNGNPSIEPKRSDWSKTVSEDTLETMTDKYGIDLEELYKLSDACQSKTGDYGGTIDSGTFKLFSDSEKPDCFYSLPVFVAAEDDAGRANWRTPCWARVQNMTSDDDDTPKVGETYLPPNLDEIMDQEFCVPCSGNSPACQIG